MVYKLTKIVGSNNCSVQFITIVSHYKEIGYNINALQQTACLVFNPISFGCCQAHLRLIVGLFFFSFSLVVSFMYC